MPGPQEQQTPLAWEVQSLRCTVFLDAPLPSSTTASWWEDLVGRPPAQRIDRPHEFMMQQDGPFGNGILTLSVRSHKVDWRYTPPGPGLEVPDGEGELIPLLGPFADARDEFVGTIRDWLGSGLPILRVAFGAVLHHRVNDVKDGYRAVDRLLPSVTIDAENSSDFLYRINRRRQHRLGENEIRINRLTTWSVIRQLLSTFVVDENPVVQPPPRALRVAVQLELDINTVPEDQDLLKQVSLPQLFDQLVVMGEEISEKGDIT